MGYGGIDVDDLNRVAAERDSALAELAAVTRERDGLMNRDDYRFSIAWNDDVTGESHRVSVRNATARAVRLARIEADAAIRLREFFRLVAIWQLRSRVERLTPMHRRAQRAESALRKAERRIRYERQAYERMMGIVCAAWDALPEDIRSRIEEPLVGYYAGPNLVLGVEVLCEQRVEGAMR